MRGPLRREHVRHSPFRTASPARTITRRCTFHATQLIALTLPPVLYHRSAATHASMHERHPPHPPAQRSTSRDGYQPSLNPFSGASFLPVRASAIFHTLDGAVLYRNDVLKRLSVGRSACVARCVVRTDTITRPGASAGRG